MLNDREKDLSFRNIRKFAEAANGTPDNFCKIFDVIVISDTPYLYRNITMTIHYDYGYMDYQVELFWEEDADQVDYRHLGLHGQYSTNFQSFTFSNRTLSFHDGHNTVSISITSKGD